MSHEERNAYAGIITNLLVNFYLANVLINKYREGAFDGADAAMVWARTVLWVIPFGIIAAIIVLILFAILYAIVTNTPKPSFLVDERDKVIGSKSTVATTAVVSAGFLIAVIAMALGVTTFAALNIMLAGFALGSLASDIAKIAFYRRGY